MNNTVTYKYRVDCKTMLIKRFQFKQKESEWLISPSSHLRPFPCLLRSTSQDCNKWRGCSQAVVYSYSNT